LIIWESAPSPLSFSPSPACLELRSKRVLLKVRRNIAVVVPSHIHQRVCIRLINPLDLVVLSAKVHAVGLSGTSACPNIISLPLGVGVATVRTRLGPAETVEVPTRDTSRGLSDTELLVDVTALEQAIVVGLGALVPGNEALLATLLDYG